MRSAVVIKKREERERERERNDIEMVGVSAIHSLHINQLCITLIVFVSIARCYFHRCH